MNAVIWRDRRCKLLQSSASYCEGHEIFVDVCLDIYGCVYVCEGERERERERERESGSNVVAILKKTQTHILVLVPAFEWVSVF